MPIQFCKTPFSSLSFNGTILLTALIAPSISMAQSGNSNQTDSSKLSSTLEEVVVTARKREESLQDVPISITAFTEANLTNMGVATLRDLEYSVPNVTFTDQGNAFGGFGIRGIYTLVRSIGVESGVSVYVDGVYQGRNSNTNIDVVGIERIEALKGPQGTLFGRNTISGAIAIATKKPGEEFEGQVTGTVGNLDRVNGSVYLSGPLVDDRFFASVVASGYKRDGFTKNLSTGDDLDNEDRQSGRINMRFLASDNLEINASIDGARDRGDTPRGGYLVTDQPGRFWNVDAEWETLSDPRVTSLDNSPSTGLGIFEERDIWGTSLTADYSFDNDFVLTSITAYRDGSFEAASDFDGTGAEIAGGTTGSDSEQFTQEVRITSPGDMTLSWLPGSFDFVGGLFYLYQDTTAFLVGTVGTGCAISTCPSSSLPGGPGTFGPTSRIETESTAAYLNASWYLSDKWSITAGVRYTREEKDLDFKQKPFAPIGIADIPPISRSSDDDNVSPLLSTTYHFTDDISVYGTIAQGYKSAGFNADVVGNDDLAFDSEKVTNYEVGFKTMLLDNRVKFNTSFFYQDYQDLQVQQFLGSVQLINNAAEAEIKGLELELDAVLTESLNLTLGLGLIDAEFKDFPDATPAGDNYSGNKLPSAPESTGYVALEYSHPVNGTTGFMIRGEWSYRGDQYFQADNAPYTFQKGYGLFNARSTLSFENGRYDVSVFANNINDKVYATNRLGFLGLQLGHWGAPRTYGLELAVNF